MYREVDVFTKRTFKWHVAFALFVVLVGVPPSGVAAKGVQDDPDILAWMQQANQRLAAQGLNIAVGQVELYTVGQGRPDYRLLQRDFRFVPNDPRRNADGNKIRYLVDSTADTPFQGDTASGLTHVQTEAAIDAAISTWQSQSCLHKVTLEKITVPDGVDPDLLDYFLVGNGHPPSQVHLFQADIVNGGWLPLSNAVGPQVLAVTFTVYFVQNGQPTDVNGDGYADTAFAEVYYNDEYAWGINQALPSIDVQSVALHENGHGLGLGHFGPPPTAVMNPFYGGIRQSPYPTDNAGLCTLWSSWPQ
jgi:hypothetical protein